MKNIRAIFTAKLLEAKDQERMLKASYESCSEGDEARHSIDCSLCYVQGMIAVIEDSLKFLIK